MLSTLQLRSCAKLNRHLDVMISKLTSLAKISFRALFSNINHSTPPPDILHSHCSAQSSCLINNSILPISQAKISHLTCNSTGSFWIHFQSRSELCLQSTASTTTTLLAYHCLPLDYSTAFYPRVGSQDLFLLLPTGATEIP